MKKFTQISDIEAIPDLLKEVEKIKQKPLLYNKLGLNKTLLLLFFNPSLRTRLSTQKAAQNLGMHCMVMNISNEGWLLEFEDGTVMKNTAAEHIKEAAMVVSQYCDVMAIRAFAGLTDQQYDYNERVINAFVNYATVPVISLESASGHPLQALADLITIKEHQKRPKPKVVLSWAPHPKALPQAVANSFVNIMKISEVDLVISHPYGYELSADITKGVNLEYNQDKAFENADFIYAKNWSSFNAYGQVLTTDEQWMVTTEKMQLTNQAKFMHCLPVRRNVIVEDKVLDSNDSLVVEQANNRTYSAQVVLKKILENG